MKDTQGYSSTVNLELIIGGHVVPLCQTGPDFLSLNDLPAELRISIDGKPETTRVLLREIKYVEVDRQ